MKRDREGLPVAAMVLFALVCGNWALADIAATE